MKKIYLLWYQDNYVEKDGSVDSPELLGVFDTVKSIQTHLKEKWFDMPIDTRELAESVEEDFRCEWSKPGKNGSYDSGSYGCLYLEPNEIISYGAIAQEDK